MSEEYRSMWKDLGLDLDAHDALLGILGNAYNDIYLSQKDRPVRIETDYSMEAMGQLKKRIEAFIEQLK